MARYILSSYHSLRILARRTGLLLNSMLQYPGSGLDRTYPSILVASACGLRLGR